MLGIRIAWLLSMIATAGSLYFSEVRGFIPCEMCWYQRILMYPLSLLLGIAVLRNEKKIVDYLWAFPVVGFILATFHYLKQKTLWFADFGACDGLVPCSAIYIDWFGFITIPFLSATAFLLIFISFLWSKKGKEVS